MANDGGVTVASLIAYKLDGQEVKEQLSFRNFKLVLVSRSLWRVNLPDKLVLDL